MPVLMGFFILLLKVQGYIAGLYAQHLPHLKKTSLIISLHIVLPKLGLDLVYGAAPTVPQAVLLGRAQKRQRLEQSS